MKGVLKKTFCIGVLGAASVLAAADYGALPAADFLRLASYRCTLQDSFARLAGRVTHLRRNSGGAEYYPIFFGVVFRPGVMDGRLLLNGSEEYRLRRRVGSGVEVKEEEGGQAAPGGGTLLKHLGMETGDLTLGFLDFPVVGEERSERVKTVDCRVLLLRRPGGGTVKVWLSCEYLFPVKAEFYAPREYPGAKPERTLEITGFKEIDHYYVVTDLALLGREWRTRIAFDRCDVGKNSAPEAQNAFSLPERGAVGK